VTDGNKKAGRMRGTVGRERQSSRESKKHKATHIVRVARLGVRRQHLEGLAQRVVLLLVVGDDNGVDDAVRGDVGVGIGFRVEVASFAARSGADVSRRGQCLRARQRGRRATAAVAKLDVPHGLGARSLAQAPGNGEDGPAGAEREDEDQEVDEQAVVREDLDERAASCRVVGRRRTEARG